MNSPSSCVPARSSTWSVLACSTASEHLFTLTAPALVVAGGSSYTEHAGASSFPSHDSMRASSELRRPVSISQHIGFESGSTTFWSPAPKKTPGALVTCEPRTLHPPRKVHSRGLQHMSAVFVPAPQAFVAAASDSEALAKNFNKHTTRGPMLHEHTDHGLLRCRDHRSAPRQRPLNGSLEAFPNNNQHARLGPCSPGDQLLRPTPSPTCFNRAKTRTP